ncbi:MAG: sn-glycerol-3-phosphate ABC transporter ATP-binding protein UgpC [Calditrichaeota bacterium]|nr:sn-glycerol-3-phosphate ABC transporter ATP-binding protein UgpC [Calditrichota bacterium]
MASVDLIDVSKVFDKGVIAVDSVNISVVDKEFVVLVGPSGCGKSTILRMIAGLEDASSGEIRIDGKIVNEVPPKDRNIAMVFQNYALYPHMTVYQNMAFGLKLRKYPKKEIEQRVDEAAEILDIANLLGRKPKALSGGQRQRVAVGRAIVRKPKVFLFDEPLSNLDAKFRVQMRTEISRLHTKLGTTMIYVTHDQVEAMTMGNRIVVLRGGKVQQIDSPLNLYNNPSNQFVAGFIGSPAMNFFKGEIIDQDGMWFRNDSLKLLVSQEHFSCLKDSISSKVILGIRPEDLLANETVNKEHNISQATCKVEIVEPMGNEIFLYLSAGQHSMTARVKPDVQPAVNSDCKIGFRMDKAHYFNVKTRENIC